MTFTAVLQRLQELALALQTARRADVAGRGVVCDLSEPFEPPLPERQAFREYCQILSPAQLYMAIMVMYAGRNDFGETFDILDRFEQMSDTFHSPDWAIGQMLEKSPLPDYLADGIRRLNRMGVEIDQLC